MKLAIGCDHAGFELKEKMKFFFQQKGISVVDFGTNSPDSVDYPDFAHPVALSVENKENDMGILICGSANGVAMAANKHPGVRASICWNEEIAELARKHNDANILCLPSRFIDVEKAKSITEVFILTPFEGGRHQNRINKIPF